VIGGQPGLLPRAPRVRFDGPIDAVVSDQVAEHLVPVVREALTSVTKHAGARDVEVELTADQGGVNLRVADDGRGIDASVTPGFGLRYLSPVGPIRFDLGYNPQGAEELTAITTRVNDDGTGLSNTAELVPLTVPVLWNPRTSVWNRLQLHISIGQAF
jgi:hypothetical protein